MHAQKLAVLHLTDPTERVLHLIAACLTSEADRPQHQDVAPEVPDIDGRDFMEVEVAVDLGPPLSHPFVSPIWPAGLIERGVLGPDLDLRMRVFDPVVDVAAIPAFKCLAYNLGVGLRGHQIQYRAPGLATPA